VIAAARGTGHWIMFLIGIFIPLFWIIGALLPPTRSSDAFS
jgi:hypothetical protein